MDSITTLARLAGNQAVGRYLAVQRCGDTPPDQCPCHDADAEDREATSETGTEVLKPVAQRVGPPGPPEPCGPGTSNPFCLPIPTDETPCKPFADHSHALNVWAAQSASLPLQLAGVLRCLEVKGVWDEYFKGTSAAFSFDSPSSCVVAAAKRDPTAAAQAETAAIQLFKGIKENLPALVRDVRPGPVDLGGPVAVLRIPLAQAVASRFHLFLHPLITYNDPFNAAANIAGDAGKNGQGSDIFGDDDREMQGTVVIEVRNIDPVTGAVSGELRWVPHVHVKDTVDFCPGNLGNPAQRSITIPLSKLEAEGLTRDVPITIDYDLEPRQESFSVVPKIGPPPGPVPKPDKGFPRSGPAKTTGTLLRVRTGPGLGFPALRLIEHKATPIQVESQVHGDRVDGNDVWDKIEGGYVSDRYITFDESERSAR
ncbi:hypothetical protein [Amycolatopsis tolypomycina]|uniref:hypothetical protein n=1 Tax=Amycolatopsis tolypomycina TaxID=208445 RepID=UPI0033A59D77